jgi:hypothetical protein
VRVKELDELDEVRHGRADFDPDRTVPVPAGSFVRRVAHTPYYDRVRPGGTEPAIIAICGIAPVGYQLIETDKPSLRKL